MKKFVSFILALTMLLAMLAGCENGAKSTESVEPECSDTSSKGDESVKQTEKTEFSDFYHGYVIQYSSSIEKFRNMERIPASQNAEKLAVVHKYFDYDTIRSFADSIRDTSLKAGYIYKAVPAEELDDTAGTSKARFERDGYFDYFGELEEDEFYVGDDPREVTMEATRYGAVSFGTDYHSQSSYAIGASVGDKDYINYSLNVLERYFPDMPISEAKAEVVSEDDRVLCRVTLNSRTLLPNIPLIFGNEYPQYDALFVYCPIDAESDEYYFATATFTLDYSKLFIEEKKPLTKEEAWRNVLNGSFEAYTVGTFNNKITAGEITDCEILEWHIDYISDKEDEDIFRPYYIFLVIGKDETPKLIKTSAI